MMIAGGTGRRAGFEEDSRRPREDADRGFEQRGLDALSASGAFARRKREQDPVGGKDAAEQVADRESDPRRAALGGSGDAHEPRHSLRDLIEAREVAERSGRAESGYAARNDA